MSVFPFDQTFLTTQPYEGGSRSINPNKKFLHKRLIRDPIFPEIFLKSPGGVYGSLKGVLEGFICMSDSF